MPERGKTMKKEDLLALSYEAQTPGGKRRVISHLQAKELSRAYGVSLKDVEIFALKCGVSPEKYERNLGSFGLDGQVKLLESRVCILGVGGLGGWIAEILARSGVGFLRLVDGDVFVESNLNRQLGSQIYLIGKNKAIAMKSRLKRVNPSIAVEAVPTFLTKDNHEAIIGDVDLCVDALGGIKQRFVLAEGCKRFKKPLVHGAIAGFLGQAALLFPWEDGLERIYGRSPDASASGEEIFLGTPSPTPAFIGALEAAIAIQFLIGKGEEYKSKLFFFDLQRGTVNQISL
jgi:molybdopterin/thiamine biosynthesis adenylyltransferase